MKTSEWKKKEVNKTQKSAALCGPFSVCRLVHLWGQLHVSFAAVKSYSPTMRMNFILGSIAMSRIMNPLFGTKVTDSWSFCTVPIYLHLYFWLSLC